MLDGRSRGHLAFYEVSGAIFVIPAGRIGALEVASLQSYSVEGVTR